MDSTESGPQFGHSHNNSSFKANLPPCTKLDMLGAQAAPSCTGEAASALPSSSTDDKDEPALLGAAVGHTARTRIVVPAMIHVATRLPLGTVKVRASKVDALIIPLTHFSSAPQFGPCTPFAPNGTR